MITFLRQANPARRSSRPRAQSRTPHMEVLEDRCLPSNYQTLDVPGSLQTTATGINDSGQIVGNYTDTRNRDHSFLYSGGSYTTLDVPNSINTYAFGINDSGQIVGHYRDAVNDKSRGFVLSAGKYTTIYGPGGSTSAYCYAFGINDSGQIVGSCEDRGQAKCFLLSGGTYTTFDVPPSSTYGYVKGIKETQQIDVI
jgi:probable HAF family extracellular repeat protein